MSEKDLDSREIVNRPESFSRRGVEAPVELLRSGLRFGWAMSLLGAWTMAAVIRRPEDATRAFGQVSAEAERQLGASSREMLRSAERLRRDVAELWTGLGEDDAGRRLGAALFEGGTGGARRALTLLAPLFGSESSLERAADILFAVEQFAGNALEPLGAKPHGVKPLGAKPHGVKPHGAKPLGAKPNQLAERVRAEAENLAALDPFLGLWRLEGLGYAYGDALWLSEQAPFELEGLSEMPIITGVGLALARRMLVTRGDPEEKARRHVELCRRWAPAGSSLMVFEAAGFIAHQLMPLRFDDMAEAAAGLGEDARAAFWHGVGRALYLSLRSLLNARGRAEHAADLIDPLERRNALAGAVWAAMLVHLRHPVHLDRFLEESADLLGAETVEGGVRGALTVWINHIRPLYSHAAEEPHLAKLVAFRGRSPLWPRFRELVASVEEHVVALQNGEATWDRVYFLPAGGGEKDGLA